VEGERLLCATSRDIRKFLGATSELREADELWNHGAKERRWMDTVTSRGGGSWMEYDVDQVSAVRLVTHLLALLAKDGLRSNLAFHPKCVAQDLGRHSGLLDLACVEGKRAACLQIATTTATKLPAWCGVAVE
jgi:hypothetical protein